MTSERRAQHTNAPAGLRFGLIGCGDIGRLRADALSRLESCPLIAANDLNGGRAQAVARDHGASVEPDWRDVLRRGDIDAVIVSTPPSLHAEMSIEALQAGKHVLCEKPLARDPAECRDMVEAAQRSGRFLATGFNYRFYPSIRKARQLLDSGVIGELDHIRSYAGYSAAEHSQPWLRDVDVMGGGALRDNGIHLIDLTRYFLGEVEGVRGYVSNWIWGFPGCEDNGFAMLRSPEGKVARLHASWTEFKGYRFEIEIYGSRGFIRARCFPMLTEVRFGGAPGQRTRRKLHLFPLTHVFEHLRSYRWVVTRSFTDEIRAFKAAIDGASTELASGYDGLIAVEIADAAARGGAEVKIGRAAASGPPPGP